jgi:membrane-associated protease RseP (regulator of RpoE activity)
LAHAEVKIKKKPARPEAPQVEVPEEDRLALPRPAPRANAKPKTLRKTPLAAERAAARTPKRKSSAAATQPAAPQAKLAAKKAPREETKPVPAAEPGLEPVREPSPLPARQPAPPAPAAAARPQSDASEAALGAVLRDETDATEVLEVLPGSTAEDMGIRAGDRLIALNGAAVRSRAEAAAAWRKTEPGVRISALVRREQRVLALESRLAEDEPAFKRGNKSLSAQEVVLKEARLERSGTAAKAEVAKAKPLPVAIPARQALWIRFPDGIKDTVATGDILEGAVTMAVATDANLDFLCLPPRSRIWGKVLQASSAEGARIMRIYFYKARLAGGHILPISARITDVAGEQSMLKVSRGGSLVAGEPVRSEGKKKKGTAFLLLPETRLRLELTESAMVTEPPQFYAAGPGLWIRTKDTESGRQFEVTHVIPGRSAEKAGLRVGDALVSVAGKSTTKLDFEDALAALYGAPGSTLKVTVQKPAAKPETFELKRGVSYQDGVENALPLPYEKPEKRSS